MRAGSSFIARFALMLAVVCNGLVCAAPVIINVHARQLPGEHRVELTYDLANAGGGACTVQIRVSTDSGTTYGEPLSAAAIEGETAGLLPAAGKTLEIKLTEAGLGNRFSREICFKVTAESGAGDAPDGFSLIPAGSFQMGDQSNPLVGNSDELPVHTVYVSEFYMSKYETTKELWDEVRAWGLNNGYTDLAVGNGVYGSKVANHPVHSITWFEIVKWCNARSQKEGLTPCYSVSGSTYKKGSMYPSCDFSANGYRLPTEAEWEKAARGGQTGKNFPWGDTISHDQANYYSSSSYGYDQSLTRGDHPSYIDMVGGYPYSSPVGSFPPDSNWGLYDMAGNMNEWCWDKYGSYTADSQIDPRGATSGSSRVLRGGCSGDQAFSCRVACRNSIHPINSNTGNIGFRTARSSVP